jgi:hypothetical protein
VRDDAYYYEVARNVALGRGVGFDGLHKTNGLHPLWLLVLEGVYTAFPRRRGGAIHWLQNM